LINLQDYLNKKLLKNLFQKEKIVIKFKSNF